MPRYQILLCLAVLSYGCAPEESADPSTLLRVGAVNLGLNANQPNVRERQDLYLSTKPGTEHSFLVDVTDDFDLVCTNEMYTWSREDSYVALVVAQYAQWGNPPVDAMSTHIFLKGGPWQIQSGSSGNFLTEDITLRSGEVTK